MNATTNDTADSFHRASREAAADFRARAGETRDYARDEMRAFLSDVEDLIKRVANVADADVARVRVRVANALTEVRRLANGTAESVRDRARYAVEATDEYVHDRPWTAIGIATALGVLLGVGVTAAAAASNRRR
jgi:ElaB/YqjD/DUF883 family membrane-anchored ribosome-binding protein